MADRTFVVGLEIEEEFDPLAEEKSLYRPDEIDDDDIDDIVDIPLIPNMPEGIVSKGIYDANNYDDPHEALRLLFDKNPSRCPVFLKIIEMCTDGKPSSQITDEVDKIQTHNKSVYAPITLCRILERAGALTVEENKTVEADEDSEAEYLEITEQIDPVWTSTQVGLDILAYKREGGALKELLEIDGAYLNIYERVLAFIDEKPRTKKEIDAIVDHDPLVQNPRRFSNHFIELLEKTDALIWYNNAWNITDLGRQCLADIRKEQ